MYHASRTSLTLQLIAVGRATPALCRIHGTSSESIEKRVKTRRLIDITAKTKRSKSGRPALATGKLRGGKPPTSRHPETSKTSTHATRLPAQELLHVDKTSQTSRTIASCSRLREAVIGRISSAYEVVPFGSTSIHADRFPKQDTPGMENFSKGDLDLVVLDKDRPLGFSPDIDSEKAARRLATILSRAGFTNVQPVPFASVPIVKFRDPQTQLSLDININNRLGLMNSYLLRSYSIKLWARPLGLNTPSGGPMTTFSTYALTLMTLGWLQSRSQAVYNCDVTFREVTSSDCYPPLSLDDTVADWFHFWGYIFDFEQQALDIKEGPIRNRNDLAVLDPKLSEHQVCVIDPFFRLKNVTNSVGSVALQKFRNECRRASDEIPNK
ncbi:hypothetical protein BKA83DRAFT_4244233 [Pisolithus microcarpus]|nr:hypothetical protein BKA83DRAFT_4244233 [Pisolithus microcarpus]